MLRLQRAMWAHARLGPPSDELPCRLALAGTSKERLLRAVLLDAASFAVQVCKHGAHKDSLPFDTLKARWRAYASSGSVSAVLRGGPAP